MATQIENGGRLLLEILNHGYSRGAWHGPTLGQSLRGVTAKVAAWRPAAPKRPSAGSQPGPARHNIWELVVHAAYWKYSVRRRLLGAKRGSFVLKGSNWFARPLDPSEKAWKADLILLDSEHQKLCEAMAKYLRSKKASVPDRLLFGVAFHDIYHAGQIRLLRRLQADDAQASVSSRRRSTR